MEDSGKHTGFFEDLVEDFTNPDAIRKHGPRHFDGAKRLSDFVGFIARLTFLFVVGFYFFDHILKQDTWFRYTTYLVCALSAFLMAASLHVKISLVAVNYGLGLMPPSAGTFTKSAYVSVTFALTVFISFGCGYLAYAVGTSNALNNVAQ